MDSNTQWSEEQEDSFNLRGVFFQFSRYWYWFALAGVLGFFVARFYLQRVTPIYQIDAELLIKDDRGVNGGVDIVDQLEMTGRKNLDNEIEILKSRPLIERVVDNLGLTVSYWHEGESRDSEIYTESPVKLEPTEILSNDPFFVQLLGNGRYALLDDEKNRLGSFGFSQKVKNRYGTFRVFLRDSTGDGGNTPIKVRLVNRDAAVNLLIASLGVVLANPGTTLISITTESALPAKGKDILSNLLEEYNFATLVDKNLESTNMLRFIDERLKLVTSELGDVENDVEKYRLDKGIIDLGIEANLFLDRVQANDAKLNEIDINLKVLDGLDSYVKNNQVGNIAPATLGITDPVLTSYIDQLSQLEAERSNKAQSLQPGNPFLETLNTQMRNVKLAIQENLRNQRTNLLVSKSSIESLNNRLEGSMTTIPRKEREFLGIKRQAGVKENLYLLLLQKREETALSYASTVTDSRVIAPPYASPGPISPARRKIYIYAILIALLIPTALIFLRELLRDKVESSKEIEKKTGMKVFGEITIVPKTQYGEVIDHLSRSFISEQLRMIRSNMQYVFANLDHQGARTLLVTSSVSGEGKSFVALNVAISLSLLNKKVVILGLDLRVPKVNEYLTVDNGVGISNYLIGQAQEEDIVKSTQFENIFLVPSGPIPPNPSELISTARMAELINSLKGSFDFIVIDTPPAGLVTDAALLAPVADATFYIVRYGVTPKHYLNTIAELNRTKRFNALSIIFNAIDYRKMPDYGYSYTYGQEGYYQKSEPKGIFQRGMDFVKRRPWLR